ncbi:MAG: InlB B-repeat-containing protein [Bacilli bacterium]|nr:InlB B-repeat-containing protein [Bacilli bacterium]
MNKITKKMLTAILSVTFSLVALGTVTFAWITLTNTATLLPIDLNVSSYGGIEVALGNEDDMAKAYYGYFTDVKKSSLITFLQNKGYDVEDDKNFELKYVTSSDGINFKDMDGNPVDDQTGGYLKFYLTLRTQTAGANVYLSPKTALTSERKMWTADAEFDNAHGIHIMPGDVLPYSLANSARMAFTSDQNLSNNVEDFIYERPMFAMDSPDDYEIDYLLYDDFYGNYSHAEGGEAEEGGAIAYFNAKHRNENHKDTSKAELAKTKSSFIKQKPIAVFNGDPDDDGFYYATISVSIWLEGWDADSINAALGGTLTVDIQFTTDDPIGYKETVKVKDDDDVQFTIPRETFARDGEAVYSDLLTEFVQLSDLIDGDNLLSGVVDDENILEMYITIQTLKITYIFDVSIESVPVIDQPEQIIRKRMLEGVVFNLPKAPKAVKGYTFVWSADGSVVEDNVMPGSDLELTGSYEVNEYNIIYQGEVLKTIKYGDNFEMPVDPTQEGAIFAGWFTDAALTKKFETPETMPANDIILFAQWLEIQD